MKKLVLTIISLLTVNAFADGFTCITDAGDLKVSVYNKVNPTDGTRSPSTMIVSDPAVMSGRKTIAKFSADNETLTSAHHGIDRLTFIGNVDLRFSDLNRAGEYMLGTRLGEVDTLQLDVAFLYGDELVDGEKVPGLVIMLKRNGEKLVREATCTRYLKGT